MVVLTKINEIILIILLKFLTQIHNLIKKLIKLNIQILITKIILLVEKQIVLKDQVCHFQIVQKISRLIEILINQKIILI
jgi:hypothetical protein